MPRAVRSLVLTLAALLAVAGCTGKGRDAPQPGPTASVTVENQAWLDMNVYVLYGGTRVRLGQVSATSTRTFTLSSSVVGLGRELRFMADPVGSNQQAESFSMFVRPNDQVRLTIPPRTGG